MSYPSRASAARKPDGPLSGLGLSIMFAVLLVDQVTKWLAETLLVFGRFVEVLPILALYPTYNTGVSFSFFQSSDSLMLTAVTAAIIVAVTVLWARAGEGGRLVAASYALIVGGALGNLVDRIFRGHVVDFLLLHLGEWTLFVFNIADVGLTIGPAILVIYYLFARREESEEKSG